MSLRIKSIWPFLRIFDVGDGSVREELAGFVVSAKAFNLGDSCAAVMLRPSMVMVRVGVVQSGGACWYCGYMDAEGCIVRDNRFLLH